MEEKRLRYPEANILFAGWVRGEKRSDILTGGCRKNVNFSELVILAFLLDEQVLKIWKRHRNFTDRTSIERIPFRINKQNPKTKLTPSIKN